VPALADEGQAGVPQQDLSLSQELTGQDLVAHALNETRRIAAENRGRIIFIGEI